MEGNAHNLNQESHEAFKALIHSLTPALSNENGKLTPGAVEKLSEKLTELVGEDAVKDFQQNRNETGELVNEEGLPIIEISESAEASHGVGTGNTLVSDENPLIPMTQLSEGVRQRLRQQRDHILDLLEEEERREQLKETQRERDEIEESLRKRREAAINERKNREAAKELQRKMGKALFRDEVKKENRENEAGSSTDRKKSVSFADDAKPKEQLDWGDVTPGRLRPASRPTLMQSAADTHIMKMHVVERAPAPPSHNSVNITLNEEQDSDDESEPASDHEEGLEQEPPQSEDDDDGDGNDDVKLEDDGVDFDFAQHQREVAMEYYKRRADMGQAATAAMLSHSHDEHGEVIPTGISTSEPSKPSISRFRANKLASAYGAASTSLEGSVISQSTARNLQRAIRTGKLDNEDHLVGGDVDSASEDENEGIQEVLELLRKGEVYNLGPDGIHSVKPTEGHPQGRPGGQHKSDSTISQEPNDTQKTFPPLQRHKVSRFKADRSYSVRTPTSSVDTSVAGTPVSEAPRSSPKLTSDAFFEKSPQTMTSGVLERKPTPLSPAVVERGTGVMSASVLERKSATVKERLDAPAPAVNSMKDKRSAFASGITERKKPAVLPAGSATTLVQDGSPAASSPFFSTVIESPSFPAPRPSQRPSTVPLVDTSRRNPKPPTIISSKTIESSSSKHT